MNLRKSIKKLIWRIAGTTQVKEQLSKLENDCAEIRYAQMFHDSTVDNEWFKYKNLSLGTAAIDYGTAYVIFRVLNQMHPQNILEFGLGQSSKIIHQYASYYDVKAVTYEHDAGWIDFFSNDIGRKYDIHIQQADLEKIKYSGCDTLKYRGIESLRKDDKFDFIFVDGPFGFDIESQEKYLYSRTQIIDLVKDNLASSFCIIMHDYERVGEQNTIDEVTRLLKEKHVNYCRGLYSAAKQCCLICSKDLYFLTTL